MQASHSSAYEESGGPRTIDHAEAYAAVQQHDPEFAPFAIYYLDGVYVADDFETRRVTVDPSTGEILGDFNTSGDDGFVPWTMSLMFNLHVCGLTCEGYVGYQAWLVEPVPGTGWVGFDGEPVSWGLLILGLTAVLLLFLSLSGIWLWWPGIKRWFVGSPCPLEEGPLRARLRPAPGRGDDRDPALPSLGRDGHGLRVRLRREGVVRP